MYVGSIYLFMLALQKVYSIIYFLRPQMETPLAFKLGSYLPSQDDIRVIQLGKCNNECSLGSIIMNAH